MKPADEILELFKGSKFGAACNDLDFARAERQLGHPVPAVLTQLYRSFNGFVGPLHISLFYSLQHLVEHSLFLRSEDYFPKFLHKAVVFGDSGDGMYWGVMLSAPGKIFEWDAEWGEEYDLLDCTPNDVWKKTKARLDGVQAQPSLQSDRPKNAGPST